MVLLMSTPFSRRSFISSCFDFFVMFLFQNNIPVLDISLFCCCYLVLLFDFSRSLNNGMAGLIGPLM